MRDEATSAIAGTSRASVAADTGALRQTVIGGPATGAVPAPDASPSPVITAEFPAVPSNNPNYGVLLPNGTVWYPGSRRKLPAPLLLRVAVWILAFITLIAAVGVAVIYLHPSWVNPLRHVANSAAPAQTRSSSGSAGGHTSTTAPAGSVRQMNPQPASLPASTTAYSVPANSYSVVVTANHPTWVGIYPVSNGQEAAAPTTQQTLAAGQTVSFPESGTVVVHIGASLATVKLVAGQKDLGTINHPSLWNFWLQPQSGG